MLSRAEKILEAVQKELQLHHHALEVDQGIRKVNFTVVIGERSADPVKVIYTSTSESDISRRCGSAGTRALG